MVSEGRRQRVGVATPDPARDAIRAHLNYLQHLCEELKAKAQCLKLNQL